VQKNDPILAGKAGQDALSGNAASIPGDGKDIETVAFARGRAIAERGRWNVLRRGQNAPIGTKVVA